MNLKDYFLKYWNKIKINKWDFLFKNKENNTNLYYILNWNIILLIWWNTIAVVGKDELLWEKSFLLNNWKPIDAKLDMESEALVLTQNDLSNLTCEERIELNKEIAIFISNRVYLLNDIINQISNLNKIISKLEINLNIQYFKNIFSNIYKIDFFYLYKKIENRYIPIFESKISEKITLIIDNIKNINLEIIEYIDEYLIIETKSYIYIFKWDYYNNKYITENVLIHSVSTLEYFWDLVEQENNKELESFLDY